MLIHNDYQVGRLLRQAVLRQIEWFFVVLWSVEDADVDQIVQGHVGFRALPVGLALHGTHGQRHFVLVIGSGYVCGRHRFVVEQSHKLGFEVNLYGLDIRRVAQENKIVDGTHVLMIKGEVSNSTNSVRKIPWLRFALLGDASQELYSWTLDTAARPLRPGETTSFVTRVAAPPELAKNLQIRFAHADEIGSNPTP